MTALERHRKVWEGKSDEWLFERLANELTQKTEEIHKLLNELEQVKNCLIADVVSMCCDETRKVNQFLKRPSKYCMTCSKELK
jgi:hypothetical protein